MNRRIKLTAWVAAALVVAFLGWREYGPGPRTEVLMGDIGIVELYAQQESGVMVEFEARVERILSDDKVPPRHQRFILTLNNGHSVLIAHNLELSERVPIKLNDRVKVHGMYQFNAQGGIVHWTHRDQGVGTRHGWIELGGKRYE